MNKWSLDIPGSIYLDNPGPVLFWLEDGLFWGRFVFLPGQPAEWKRKLGFVWWLSCLYTSEDWR